MAKSKQGASTGSAKPGTVIERFLHPHADELASEPLRLEVTVRANAARLLLRYRLTGTLGGLAIPPSSASRRTDRLWRHTCFEAFVQLSGGPAYIEINLSPSTEWAIYRFADYRAGMQPLDNDPPRVRMSRTHHALELTASVRLPPELRATRLGLSAVIEEASGRRSYWALAHPPGAPDFHHPDCFVLELPAPGGP